MEATLGKYALVTLEEARDYLKRESGDDDQRVVEFINYATAEIEVYTKRKLLSRTYDGGTNNESKMKLSGRGSIEIGVREYPVTSVSAIAERYADGVTTRSLSLTGMKLLLGGRRILLPYDVFSPGCENIEVTCVAGYGPTAHPSEVAALKASCLRWLQIAWQDRELAIGRGANLTTGGESLSLIGDPLPKDVALKLRPFERFL